MSKLSPSVSLERVFPVRIGKQVIYTVTCHEPGNGKKGKDFRRSNSRVWGWFKGKHRAISAVENNALGIFEMGYYTYAVVEGVPSGICPYCRQVQWFKYNRETKKVTKIGTPAFAKNIVNFSMG